MYDTTAEEWRDIVGYEGLYKISSHGRVKSYHARYKKPRILKTSMTTTGYRKVELAKNKVKKSHKIHRLVAEAFIPNEGNKPYINHLDSNPLNNNVNNLEWCTQKENMVHSAIFGNHKSLAWKNKEQVVTDYISGKSIRYLAKKYAGNSCVTIKNVLKREGVRIRSVSEQKMKYKYSREEMLSMFEEGLRNVDIAKELGIPRVLVNTYKHKWKNGEKLC
mgnify:FL=1